MTDTPNGGLSLPFQRLLADLGLPVLLDALEHMPDAITLSRAERDGSGRATDMVLLWMNAAARAGQPDPASAIGRRGSALWPQMIRNGAFAACLRVLDSGTPAAGEFLWTETRSYGPAGYDYKATRLPGDLLLWVLRDSTARVKEAETLAGRLRTLFDHAPTGVAHVAADGTIREANAALVTMLRTAPAALVGTRLAAHAVRGDVAGVDRALAAADHQPKEAQLVAADGVRLWVRLRVSRLPGVDAGVPPDLVVQIIDITAEVQLRHLQQVNLLGELAGGVAHDVNNLLTAVSGNAELLSRTPDRAERDRYVATILEAVDQGRQLTRQILTFSRRSPADPVRLDVNGLVNDTARLITSSLPAHLSLDTRLEPNLPPIQIDRGQLSQVLMNLAFNARDAMPTGGQVVVATSAVAVATEDLPEWPELHEGVHVRLTVADTGEGMPPQIAAQAFQPYFTTKPKGQGTGLGLATVQAIVTRAHGALRLYSEPGKGTVIRILLPGHGDGAGLPVRWHFDLSRLNGIALVVDDDQRTGELAGRLIAGAGLRARVTSSPAEAQVIAEQESIDLLLTDLVMPGLSGPRLADRLRQRLPALPVVYMSGYTDGLLDRANALPPNTVFVEKPFTRAELLTAVGRAIEV